MYLLWSSGGRKKCCLSENSLTRVKTMALVFKIRVDFFYSTLNLVGQWFVRGVHLCPWIELISAHCTWGTTLQLSLGIELSSAQGPMD